MGTISVLKMVCRSVLLTAVLTTFLLSRGIPQVEKVSCTFFIDVWCYKWSCCYQRRGPTDSLTSVAVYIPCNFLLTNSAA